MRTTPRPDSAAYLAVIRVVGVGGAGLNAVNRMIEAGISQVEFIAVNTDIQQLQQCEAPIKLHIGRELTQGLGSGADPDVGRRAAEEAYDQIKHVLRGSDMVFVTAGEGGGTGSGAAPVVAQLARDVGALTVGIVTMPFRFEGTRRRAQAEAGAETLREVCDTVIVIPNDRLLEVLDRSTSMLDAFRIADDVLRQGVQGICDLITMPGLINLDFADVRTIMSRRRLRADGHRLRHRREPGARGRRAGAALAAHRHGDRRRAAASCSRSPAATTCRCSRSTRRPRSSARRDRRDEHHLRRDHRRAARRAGLGDRHRDGHRQAAAGRDVLRHGASPTRSSRRASSATSRRPSAVPGATLCRMKGAVAAGHPLTAQAGARILAEGGNAVDACIAAAFVSWVAESPLTGPGGGGFMLVHSARDGRDRLLDFFVAVPGAGLPPGERGRRWWPSTSPSTSGRRRSSCIGPAAVAVPGMRRRASPTRTGASAGCRGPSWSARRSRSRARRALERRRRRSSTRSSTRSSAHEAEGRRVYGGDCPLRRGRAGL